MGHHKLNPIPIDLCLLKCYSGFPRKPHQQLVRFQLLQNFLIYRKLALGQINIDRKVQGCQLPLTPSTLCLDTISRRKEVKSEGTNSAVAEAILVLRGHIPHALVERLRYDES